MNWIPGLPDIPKGTRKEFIVCGISHDGRKYVTAAFYMNGHVMPCNEDCDPPSNGVPHNPDEDGYCEEYEWTGWSLGSCDYCNCEWFENLKVIAHMPFPAAFDVEAGV